MRAQPCTQCNQTALAALDGAVAFDKSNHADGCGLKIKSDLLEACSLRFASTFGEFFVAHASEITALPPRRST